MGTRRTPEGEHPSHRTNRRVPRSDPKRIAIDFTAPDQARKTPIDLDEIGRAKTPSRSSRSPLQGSSWKQGVTLPVLEARDCPRRLPAGCGSATPGASYCGPGRVAAKPASGRSAPSPGRPRLAIERGRLLDRACRLELRAGRRVQPADFLRLETLPACVMRKSRKRAWYS